MILVNVTKLKNDLCLITCLMLEVLLGLADYDRRFIPEFSTIAAPLNYLTRKGKKFCWTSKCQTSFES